MKIKPQYRLAKLLELFFPLPIAIDFVTTESIIVQPPGIPLQFWVKKAVRW
ncbi:MAG: hypothetical protein WBV73_06885 [Phormidium sp.]